MNSYDDFMIFIAIMGNFFLYFQAFSLFQQRKTISWIEEGSYLRIGSYAWSSVCFVFWIAYSILNNVTVILISTVIGLVGSTCCITIILFYSITNKSLDNPSNEFLVNTYHTEDDAL